nr:hypothetical protein GCM10020092_100320 [Actinoplanes digitatis]
MATAAAIGPPDRVDEMTGLTIVYPGQSAYAKYCGIRSAASRCSSTETPFGAYAYLCRSTEMLVTPGTEKSKSGRSAPSRLRYGSTQPPKQASTWNRTPRSAAAAAISAIGSTTPCAYDGAEAATRTVSAPIAAAIAAGSARRPASTGTTSRATRR